MAQSGWQIATLLLALTTVGGVFGTVANKSALAEAERQLANAATTPAPHAVESDRPCLNDTELPEASLSDIRQARMRSQVDSKEDPPPYDKCINGTPFKKLPSGEWANMPGFSCR